MSWFKKKVVIKGLKPKKIKTVTIQIHFKQGNETGIIMRFIPPYVYKGYMQAHGVRNFYRWYFGRPQSQHYRLIHGTGEHLIIRSNINFVSVDVREERL